MKKLYSFFKSMRFGLILLVLIAVCSVIGSIIPQDKEISWYVQNYQDLHGVILLCKAHRIFQSWYFIVLLALLSLNLLLCTVTRLRTLLSTRSGPDPVTYSPDEVHLSEAGMSMLHEHLTRMRCRESRYGDSVIYRKNSFGRYGTFITHLSILLTVIFGAAALYLPTTIDQTCVPGESITMEDGTEIAVDSFHIENEYGDLDYASKVTVTLPNGKRSDLTEVSVNHPLSFGEYKIYQQTYGTAGSVTVRNTDTDGVDTLTLTDQCFLSIDGNNGMWYEAIYPGYIQEEDETITLITSTTGRYEDPVYQVLLSSDGVNTPVLAFPGEKLTVYNMEFTFNDPVEYPGLRIKHTPKLINALLIAVFVLMIIGLYITFFLQPVLVKVDDTGYAVGGPKPDGMRIELQTLLENEQVQEENDEC